MRGGVGQVPAKLTTHLAQSLPSAKGELGVAKLSCVDVVLLFVTQGKSLQAVPVNTVPL